MAFNPFFFNDSPLPLELIQKALTDLEYLNPTVEQIKIKVDKLVDDLDATIREDVQRVIDEMYERGDFAQIIGDLINDIGDLVANTVINKTGDFDLSHMGYILHKAHSYGVSKLPVENANLTINEEFYSALQGNTVFDINGNMYWACCYICQNGGNKENNNAARLYVYTINQDGSLSYVTDKEFAAVGHCNSMCYFDGYLYITPNSYSGSGGGLTTDVLRVSFDGQTLGGTDAGNNKYTMERKTPTGFLYVTNLYSDCICTDGEQLYLFDGHNNVYTYDWDTNAVTVVYTAIDRRTADGASIDSNYIYFGAAGYRIKRFNRKLGYVDWVYQLPYKPNNHCFKIGEVEGFTVVNGVLYLAGFYNLAGVSTKYNTYSITHFYRQNLATNNIEIPNFVNWSNGFYMRIGSFIVSGNLPDDTDGSRNDYINVPCIQVAIDFLESNDYMQRGDISVRQPRNLSTIDITTAKPLNITGTYYLNNEGGKLPSIGHIFSRTNSSVYIIDINISNRLPKDINDVNQTDNCICSLGGCITIKNCAFPTGLITNSNSVKYAIKAYHGLLNVITAPDYSTDPSVWEAYRNENLGVSDAHFTVGSGIVRNINQNVTGN